MSERIKAFKAILGDVDPSSLEQAADNFKRDMHPEREVEVWERIARAYQAFIRRHHIADHQMRREVFAVLLGSPRVRLTFLTLKLSLAIKSPS